MALDLPQRQRIQALQKELSQSGIDYLWIPNADPYLNEYVLHRCRWLWHLLAFKSSAGDLIVSPEAVVLFVDGRYHLQADAQFAACETVTIEKVGAQGGRDPVSWLAEQFDPSQSATLAFDFSYFAHKTAASIKEFCQHVGLTVCNFTLAKSPALQRNLALERCETQEFRELEKLDSTITGSTFEGRFAVVVAQMAELEIDHLAVTKLDQTAWFLGLRGRDIEFNPVFESKLLLSRKSCQLFLRDEHKQRASALLNDSVQIRDMGDWARQIASMKTSESTWFVDPERISHADYRLVIQSAGKLLIGTDLIESLKAVKNSHEIAAMQRAGEKAGAAKWRTRRWLLSQLSNSQRVTEKDFAHCLEQNYRAQIDFRGLSFDSIVGAGSNGAIVHYSSPSEVLVSDETPLLVDSGAHYLGGTTDATRVFCQRPSEALKRLYTLCLKSHIAGARLKFPVGTNGVQIDSIIRAPLWNAGENYLHGTGHGVGAFLNVHEGPMLIGSPSKSRKTEVALEPGHVVSIEPGLYHGNFAGVRIENLYVVCEDQQNSVGQQMLRFEWLTFIPIEFDLCQVETLTRDEKQWLRDYHNAIIGLYCSERPSAESFGLSTADLEDLEEQCRRFCDLVE